MRSSRDANLPDYVAEGAFRYMIVAPLLDPGLSREEARAYRRKALAKKHEHPRRGWIRVTSRSLRRWKRRFRDGQLQALYPLPRGRGGTRVIAEEALELAQKLLEENPRRSSEFLINELEHNFPELRSKIKKSTLNRHLRLRNVNRRVVDDDGTPSQTSFVPFQAKKPNNLWQSDVHHGPPALVNGRVVATKIIAWIDDFSRAVCHCQAYPDETLPMLEDCLKQAMKKYGIPKCCYTDNGSIYSGIQFSLICADLGIIPFTSQPYSPWTHGKIERLWGVQEDQLWSEVALVDPLPIEKLNRYLQAWVEVSYHQRLHSQTGEMPRLRWKQSVQDLKVNIRYPTDEQVKRIFWLWERRRVSSTSLVQLHRNDYAVDPQLAGARVLVRFDPYNLKAIQVWSNAKRPELLGEFTAQTPLTSLQAPRPTASPRGERKPSAAAQRRLDDLERQFEQHQRETLGLIQFPTNTNKEVP